MASKKNLNNIIVKDESSTWKTFDYKIGEGENLCTLNFKLRVDMQTQLKYYIQLLERAQVEVQKEIDRLKGK